MNRTYFVFIGLLVGTLLSGFYLHTPDLQPSGDSGADLYQSHCLACHMADGKGVPAVFPPLAQSDYLLADKERAIRQTIFGVSGEMTVNGVEYYGDMPAQYLNDEEVVKVMNYILNSWGNNGGKVSLEQVKKIRAAGKK